MTAMDHGNAITLYDNAKYWVAQYESVDELKDFIDKAAAIKEYARRACDFELEKKAAKARIRAERRIGELLAMTEKSRGGDRRSSSFRREVDSEFQRVCKTAGINKDQSSRFQKLAAIPEASFEESLSLSADAGPPTSSGILRMHAPKEPAPRLNEDALWLWGQLCDFEKDMLSLDPAFLLSEMTPTMRADALRIIPKLKQWLP